MDLNELILSLRYLTALSSWIGLCLITIIIATTLSAFTGLSSLSTIKRARIILFFKFTCGFPHSMRFITQPHFSIFGSKSISRCVQTWSVQFLVINCICFLSAIVFPISLFNSSPARSPLISASFALSSFPASAFLPRLF